MPRRRQLADINGTPSQFHESRRGEGQTTHISQFSRGKPPLNMIEFNAYENPGEKTMGNLYMTHNADAVLGMLKGRARQQGPAVGILPGKQKEINWLADIDHFFCLIQSGDILNLIPPDNVLY